MATGTVPLTLDGDAVELRCTVDALKRLCLKYDNLRTVAARIPMFDFVVICDVIEVGLGKDVAPKRGDLERVVYERGLLNLSTPLTKFIGMLAAGGHDIDETKSADGVDGEEAPDPNAI